MRATARLSAAMSTASITLRTVGWVTSRLGWRVGMRAALLQRYSRKLRLQHVCTPAVPSSWARIGIGQTDLNILVHVFADAALETPALDGIDMRWIIDAGANAGYTTHWLARRYPGATVIAVEPDPGNVELLRRNTEHLGNVVVEQAALSDHVGELDLIDVGAGPWAMRVGAAGQGEGVVVGRIACTTVDELVRKHGIDRIGLLKIDIEGSERDVFLNSRAWMDRVDAVAAELHDRFRPGCTRALIEATAGFSHETAKGETLFVIRDAPAAAG